MIESLFLSCFVMITVGIYILMSRPTGARMIASLDLILTGVIGILVLSPYALAGLKSGEAVGSILIGVDAAVLAVAIALLLVLFRRTGLTDLNKLDELKG